MWEDKETDPKERTILQKKDLDPPEELNEKEASNLSNIEFKVIVIRILNSMKKDTETIKKDQSETKNTISEMKNTLEGIKSRLDEAEF